MSYTTNSQNTDRFRLISNFMIRTIAYLLVFILFSILVNNSIYDAKIRAEVADDAITVFDIIISWQTAFILSFLAGLVALLIKQYNKYLAYLPIIVHIIIMKLYNDNIFIYEDAEYGIISHSLLSIVVFLITLFCLEVKSTVKHILFMVSIFVLHILFIVIVYHEANKWLIEFSS